MKITAIHVYQVDLPLNKPYWLSGGRLKFEKLDSTIVAIETDAGITGWGEGCPWGVTYLPAFGGGIRAGIAELAPNLLRQNPLYLDQINRTMDVSLPGHLYVKSPIDMACWDILGKHSGLPLYALLGGKYQDDVPLHSSISTDTPQGMVENVRGYRKRGYKIHSAKVGGSDVDTDIERIRALLEDCPAGDVITFDVNRAWLPSEAIAVMNATADSRAFFEQPCETLDQCRQVRELTHHNIILDENIQAFQDLLLAQRYNVAQAIGLKVNRVGGLTKAKRMRDFCVETGIKMNIEDTGGSAIADTAAVHLAMATPAEFDRATWDRSQHHSVVTATGGYTKENGRATVSDRLGLGIEPNLDVLGEPVATYKM